ncbi:MAG: HlyD family efflux transporter periplasmic adaptor subunit [Pseudomonadota bacterium]
MKVIRERPCQRRHHRVTAPLHVKMGGDAVQYRATDWSLGGLRLDGVAGDLPAIGTELQLNLVLPFQGFDIGFELKARVVRLVETERTVAFEYTEVPERSRDLMSHFIEDLIRGQMGTVEDAICRIDIPVTPISTQPDPNPQSDAPVSRWPVKTILMSCLYILLGSAVFGYGGLLTYSSIMRLEVQSAVVSVPVQTLRMPVDGVLRSVRYSLGDHVRRGAVVAEIEDPRLDAQIMAADAEAKDAGAKYLRAKERYRIEAERLKLYQTINKTDLDVARARLEARRVALNAADANYARVATLHKKGFSNAKALEEARSRQLRAAAQVRELELSVEQATVMHSASDKRHYNHKEFVVDLDMLALDLDEAHGRLKLARAKLQGLRQMQAARVIRAPFDGQIVSMPVAAGLAISKEQPVLALEQDVPPTVTAFLDQNEVLRIGMNDRARVYVPALGRHVEATVIGINRKSGHLDLKSSQYTWKANGERTASVSLLLSAGDRKREIRAGLPAVVIFDRRMTNDLFARIANFWSREDHAGSEA